MTIPNTPWTRLAILLVLQCLTAGPAWSQNTGEKSFDVERSRQESIYHGRGEQLLEGYVIDRSLTAYGHALNDGFADSLAGLGPEDRWLDIGAGQGLAILDYFAPSYEAAPVKSGKARVVAMSIEDRRTPRWKQVATVLGTNQLQYLYNKRLREYSAGELGRFQLITDVIGGFSYTEDLTLFMEKVLAMLTVYGNFYSVMQDVRSEQGINKPHYAGAPYLTEIKKADGTDLGICAWLKSISCVEVTCQLKADWVPPIESYRVHKTCNEVNVPKLERVHFQAGTPPERGFRLVTPAPQAPAPGIPAAPVQ